MSPAQAQFAPPSKNVVVQNPARDLALAYALAQMEARIVELLGSTPCPLGLLEPLDEAIRRLAAETVLLTPADVVRGVALGREFSAMIGGGL